MNSQNPKKIIIRIHANEKIGMGHFFRCFNLASVLKQSMPELNIIFMVNHYLNNFLQNQQIINSESFDELIDSELIKQQNPSLVILDSYEISDRYLETIKQATKYLALFDDNNDLHEILPVDILINGNIYAEHLSYEQFTIPYKLLGPKYMILKRDYQITPLNFDFKNKEGILITSGAADPYKMLIFLYQAVRELPIKKTIIVGPLALEEERNYFRAIYDNNVSIIESPSTLIDYIDQSALVITAAGSTIYEVLARRTPLIIFQYAENQKNNAIYLEQYGVMDLGWFSKLDANKLAEIIIKSYKNQDYIKKLTPLFDLIDGKGAERIITKIRTLVTQVK